MTLTTLPNIVKIGIAFIGGAIMGIGAVKGANIILNKKRAKADELYFYETEMSEDDTTVTAIISENKLADLLEAIINVTVDEPRIYIMRDAVTVTNPGCAKVIFEADYNQHLEILKKAGIEYTIDEEGE